VLLGAGAAGLTACTAGVTGDTGAGDATGVAGATGAAGAAGAVGATGAVGVSTETPPISKPKLLFPSLVFILSPYFFIPILNYNKKRIKCI
jgi:hypothetical protein